MRIERRRLLITIALAIAATATAVLVLGQAAHYAELAKRLRGAQPGWLVICVAGEAIAYAGFVASYRAMAALDGGPSLGLATVVRVIGLSFGAFAVATTIGGLAVDFWALREAGEPSPRASARIIALETLRWALLGTATCIAAVAVLLDPADRVPAEVPIGWLVVVSSCFAGGIWFSSARRRERFTSGEGGRLRRALGVAVTALVLIRKLRPARPGLRAHALGGAVLFWGGELVCAAAALRAFGTSVAPGPLLLGYTTGYLAEGLPLPVGGSGSVDAALTGGFVLAGAPLSAALVGAIAFRVFSFWLPAVAALLSVVSFRSLHERLREVARTGGREVH